MRLTGAHITAGCRENRGEDGAWDEAVARLREVYHYERSEGQDGE